MMKNIYNTKLNVDIGQIINNNPQIQAQLKNIESIEKTVEGLKSMIGKW